MTTIILLLLIFSRHQFSISIDHCIPYEYRKYLRVVTSLFQFALLCTDSIFEHFRYSVIDYIDGYDTFEQHLHFHTLYCQRPLTPNITPFGTPCHKSTRCFLPPAVCQNQIYYVSITPTVGCYSGRFLFSKFQNFNIDTQIYNTAKFTTREHCFPKGGGICKRSWHGTL